MVSPQSAIDSEQYNPIVTNGHAHLSHLSIPLPVQLSLFGFDASTLPGPFHPLTPLSQFLWGADPVGIVSFVICAAHG